jgi:hypothetical protein
MSARMQPTNTSSAVAFAAPIILGASSRLSASPIQVPVTYSTSGMVESLFPGDPPYIRFLGVDSGAQATGNTFNLGKFYSPLIPIHESIPFTDLPFQIVVHLQTINGDGTAPNNAPIIINGTLNGTLAAFMVPGARGSLSAVFPAYGYIPEEPPRSETSVPPSGQATTWVTYLSNSSTRMEPSRPS